LPTPLEHLLCASGTRPRFVDPCLSNFFFIFPLFPLAMCSFMHTTFLFFSRSCQLGSNFWLPSTIISAVLALLLSLPLPIWFLPHPMDPVALTEALPFIVCTLSFNKPHPRWRHEFRRPAQVCRRNHPRLFVYGVYPVARIKLLLVSTIHTR
jgi:hypothetical protein